MIPLNKSDCTKITRRTNYSIFFLNCFLKITGDSDRIDKPARTAIDCQEKASLDFVRVCKVSPALIAITDGGATPKEH